MLSGTLRREHPQPKHPTVEISTVDKSNGTRTLDGEHSINIPRYENTGSAHIKSGIAPSVTSSGVTYRRDCEQGNIWVDVLTAKTTRILYVVYASVPIEHRSDAQATLESIVKTFAVTSDLTIEQYRKVLRANIEAHPPNPAALAVTPTYIAERQAMFGGLVGAKKPLRCFVVSTK